MSLKERCYSILIVSATDSFTSAIGVLLPESRDTPIHNATTINVAKRMIAERSYDFVIINSPLSDDIGTRFAIDTCTLKHTAVLLLVKADIHATIHDKVAKDGVFTLPKPISKAILIQALYWMESMRERLRQFEKKSVSIEEKMAEIRIVNKEMCIRDSSHTVLRHFQSRCCNTASIRRLTRGKNNIIIL